jgi:hypothetical protein
MARCKNLRCAGLREHVYRVLCQQGVPIFWQDFCSETDLRRCGILLGCRGLRLLEIVLDLVRDGLLVAYHERGERSLDDIAVLPHRQWEIALEHVSDHDRELLERSVERFEGYTRMDLGLALLTRSEPRALARR